MYQCRTIVFALFALLKTIRVCNIVVTLERFGLWHGFINTLIEWEASSKGVVSLVGNDVVVRHFKPLLLVTLVLGMWPGTEPTHASAPVRTYTLTHTEKKYNNGEEDTRTHTRTHIGLPVFVGKWSVYIHRFYAELSYRLNVVNRNYTENGSEYEHAHRLLVRDTWWLSCWVSDLSAHLAYTRGFICAQYIGPCAICLKVNAGDFVCHSSPPYCRVQRHGLRAISRMLTVCARLIVLCTYYYKPSARL